MKTLILLIGFLAGIWVSSEYPDAAGKAKIELDLVLEKVGRVLDN
jgi:hypothetical protein